MHAINGLLLAVWLVVFLVIIGPFDVSDLGLWQRLIILPFYGVITFLGYMMLIPVQNWLYRIFKQWNIGLEVLFILLFNLVCLTGCFAYYRTSIVNGTFSFQHFTFGVYYPIFFLLLPMLVFARWFLFRKPTTPDTPKITLTGDNKLDLLQIDLSDLVCVSSADNYVEVNYLVDQVLQKKLLRNTLKNIQQDVPTLLKVHRSHLINPAHLIEWKQSNVLVLTQIEIPTTKTYRGALEALMSRP